MFRSLVTAGCGIRKIDFHVFDSSDDRVVRAYASGAIDLGLIASMVKPMTLKLVFTASLLDAQH